MQSSFIDFSAEFGGQDAADAVLSHFKCLKSAAKGIKLEGFPFPELAYILRVDGTVNCYGLLGSGYLEVDKGGEYVSVDIGIPIEHRGRISEAICTALLTSINDIRKAATKNSWQIDFESLEQTIRQLIENYKHKIHSQPSL